MKTILFVPGLVGIASAYTRFSKYEECVSYCDNNPTCQSAFFDTISGDCQDHQCIYGQTPPDRFKSYIKSAATEYCPGTSPTATGTKSTVVVTKPTLTPTSLSSHTAAASMLRADYGLVLAAVGVVVRFAF